MPSSLESSLQSTKQITRCCGGSIRPFSSRVYSHSARWQREPPGSLSCWPWPVTIVRSGDSGPPATEPGRPRRQWVYRHCVLVAMPVGPLPGGCRRPQGPPRPRPGQARTGRARDMAARAGMLPGPPRAWPFGQCGCAALQTTVAHMPPLAVPAARGFWCAPVASSCPRSGMATPSPGADVAGVGPVQGQMWQGRVPSWHRRGRVACGRAQLSTGPRVPEGHWSSRHASAGSFGALIAASYLATSQLTPSESAAQSASCTRHACTASAHDAHRIGAKEAASGMDARARECVRCVGVRVCKSKRVHVRARV